MPRLQIKLLGAPEVLIDGRDLRTDTRKAIALLAYLVVTGETQSRDALAALLWPDYDQENARSSLRRTLSTLRKALGGDWLTAQRDVVRLDMTNAWSDAAEFRELLKARRAHQHDGTALCAECDGMLARAEELHRGDFMSGFTLRDSLEFEEWQFAQADAFRRDLDGVLAELGRSREASSRLDEAIVFAGRRLRIDHLNEAAHAGLMRLYALAGDRTGALKQYRECLKILSEELGVGPLEETTALYGRIAAGELVGASPSRATPAVVREASEVVGSAELPLTGRDVELGVLRAVLQSPSDTRRLVVIEGEPGIGKTRLLREALGSMHAAGLSGLVALCYEGEGSLAYAPIIGLLHSMVSEPGTASALGGLSESELTESARLLPALLQFRPRLDSPPPLESPASQVRFLEALQAALLAGNKVLAIEDVQWADDATVDLLVFIARRLDGFGARIILTWRTEEMPEDHKLRRLLRDLLRDQHGLHLHLTRLDEGAVDALVKKARGDDDATAAAGRRLYKETEGLPFFIAEFIAAGALEGQWTAPPSVADLMYQRLARLSGRDRQLLATAAVIGRSFDFETLREASGRSEEDAVGAIESLSDVGVLRSVEATPDVGPVYDFTHEKLRSFVYDSLDASRRRLLHKRVGEALTHGHSRTRGPTAGQAANHFLQAGETARAASHFEAAGRSAQALHANVEAISHFRSAISAGHESVAGLYRRIGELQMLTGAYRGALDSLQLAAALASEDELVTNEHLLGNVYLRLGEWQLADHHLSAALAKIDGEKHEAVAARVCADLSFTAYRQGRLVQASEWGQRALTAAQDAKDRLATAQAHNILGILATATASISEAVDHLESSLQIAAAEQDDPAQIAALNNLALAWKAAGNATRALVMTQQALELCRGYGDRHREAALLNNLADLSRDLGDEQQAMDYLKQAVAIFAEIGADAGDAEPEIWKLVQW